MKSFKNKIVWITGASSGIGASLAVAFAKQEAKLVLIARDLHRLKEVQDMCTKYTTHCFIQSCDLSIEKEVSEVFINSWACFNGIDILINNAGISQRALTINTSLATDRVIMETNYFSKVALTKLVLPKMMSNNSGHIVAISSIVGKFGSPLRTAYSASKHAVQGFFESLRAELNNTNISVTIVSPGYIRTNISLNALSKNGKKYGKMDKNQENGMDPDKCADKILIAIKRNKKELLVGGKELIMVYIRRFLPMLYYKTITKFVKTI